VERQRRRRARQREEKLRDEAGVTLSAAAIMAENEARKALGDDFGGFESAVRDYVLAVDEAEHARGVWIEHGKPMRDTFANGMGGVHPFFKAMETARTQASRLRSELGLSPASAKRINGAAARGRPVGSVSAPDRKAQAPPMKLKAVP
jgi:hypothetical protein